MDFLNTLRLAIRALARNKMRSSLTMLGIIIGVGAVIAMVGIGAGAQARAAEQNQSLGSNLIIVLSGSITSGGLRMALLMTTVEAASHKSLAATCPFGMKCGTALLMYS